MSHTYLFFRVHLLWATRRGRPWLDPEWRSRLFACVETSTTRKGARLLCAGGTRDHLHLYLELPATLPLAELVATIKASTSRWIHQTFPHRRDFAWQHGFAAFTVNPSDDVALRDYIRNQEIHHRGRALTGEYVALLERHGLSYDLMRLMD